MIDTTQDQPPVLPGEGLHVIHAFFRFDRMAPGTGAPSTVQERFRKVCESIRARPSTWLILFSVVSPKADFGWMLLTDDLQYADLASKRLVAALGPEAAVPVYSYLSMTERSEYTTSAAEYAVVLEKEEKIQPGTPEFAEKMEAFEVRMAKYGKDRLYPNLPDWPVVCFYPMSKKRETGQNWYALDFERRKELMKGHAKVGRTYSGRILQLITGSTGLDEMEWGVTLFAKTTSEIKAIVYEMRFDEVSALYADFGDFFIGLQMTPDQLLARLDV